MGNHSNRGLFLTFAGWTLFAVVAVGIIIVPLHLRDLRGQAEDDAATIMTSLTAPRLEDAAGDLSTSGLTLFTNVAGDLIGDQLLGVRLWTPSGELLTSAGADEPVQPSPAALASVAGGGTPAFKAGSADGDILVSYAPVAASAVLELRQDYAPIAGAINKNRRDFLITVLGGAVALVLLLPLGLWAALRGLRGEYSRLLYLYKTGKSMRSTLDLANVLEGLARDAALFVHADLSLVTLIEEGTDELLVKASFDGTTNTNAQHHRKVEHWFLRRCVATSQAVVSEEQDFPYKSLIGHDVDNTGPVATLSVAIRGREQAIGVLTLVRDAVQGPLDPSQVEVLEEMAAQAATALDQALLFSKVRSYADEVEVSYDATLKVLMAALDTKDSATMGHSERVTRLTLTLAREMGVPNERLADIERGALLHDVGKIGVPDAILNKPEALNEGEWEAMQKHPILAGLMISQVGFLEGALPILLYHHERYDGAGYPFGLQAEAIPLEARIFSVVDSYDAMTSDRPYRKAISIEDALQEIRRNGGSQFDPEVAVAFERVVRRERPATKHAA